MRWNLATGLTALALIPLVLILAPSYVPIACLLLEGGSRSKILTFLTLVAVLSLGSLAVRRRPAVLATGTLLLTLPFASNVFHCIAAGSIGIPPEAELFVFDGRIIEGDSPLHAHIGKAALTWVLKHAFRIPSNVHCGKSLARMYPPIVLLGEFSVVLLALLMGVLNSRDPVSCLASSLLALSTIDGGAFSLPYVHGAWLLSLRYVRERRIMLTFLWFAMASPYAKLVLGTLLTYAHYGTHWETIHLRVVTGPLDEPLKSLGGTRWDGYYSIPVKSVTSWRSFLNNLESELQRSGVRWVVFYTYPNVAVYL